MVESEGREGGVRRSSHSQLLLEVPGRAPLLALGWKCRSWAEPRRGRCEDSRQVSRKPSARPLLIWRGCHHAHSWEMKWISGEGGFTCTVLGRASQATDPRCSTEMLLQDRVTPGQEWKVTSTQLGARRVDLAGGPPGPGCSHVQMLCP